MSSPKQESTDADTSRPPQPADRVGQKKCRDNLELDSDIGLGFRRVQEDFEPLGAYLFGATTVFYEFFHANGYQITKRNFESGAISKQLSVHLGWVYAFYGEGDEPIYVGETERSFVDRFSEHARKGWWPNWTRAKVLPCPEKGLRKYFESMVGIAGGYSENRAQPSDSDDFFDQILRSLFVLGSNLNNQPEVPLSIFRTQIEMVSELLELGCGGSGIGLEINPASSPKY